MSKFYENPLCTRYASDEMKAVFSDDTKFKTWRRLWVDLAKAQKSLGLDITQEQIAQLEKFRDDINYDVANEYEKKFRHDVMAHVHAYGEQAPKAKPIIHLGATSCYVGDNTDIIVMRKALLLIRAKLITAIFHIARFADKYKATPTLGYTHFQSAQPTTAGKRATLWLHDVMMDLEELDFTIASIKLLGCKGTTGTQASLLALFDGDDEKVEKLEGLISQKWGLDVYPVSGQTYSRKVDYKVLSCLSGIAQSASKFANDFRLLSHLKEVREPFEEGQIGSSAMAYKKNPMRSERISSLSRFVIANAQNPALNASTQWFERTLDDSANRRISIPQSFLAIDGILSLYINIISKCTVNEEQIAKRLREELPFMATENILMQAVKNGGDRQELHEEIRKLSQEPDLLDNILASPKFNLTRQELEEILDVNKFIGRSLTQTESYLGQVNKVLAENKDFIGKYGEVTV